jgi:hypothetical protein
VADAGKAKRRKASIPKSCFTHSPFFVKTIFVLESMAAAHSATIDEISGGGRTVEVSVVVGLKVRKGNRKAVRRVRVPA